LLLSSSGGDVLGGKGKRKRRVRAVVRGEGGEKGRKKAPPCCSPRAIWGREKKGKKGERSVVVQNEKGKKRKKEECACRLLPARGKKKEEGGQVE